MYDINKLVVVVFVFFNNAADAMERGLIEQQLRRYRDSNIGDFTVVNNVLRMLDENMENFVPFSPPPEDHLRPSPTPEPFRRVPRTLDDEEENSNEDNFQGILVKIYKSG